MAVQTEDANVDLIGKVVRVAQRRGLGDDVQAFLRLLYADVDTGDLAADTAEDLCGAGAGLLAFLSEPRGNGPAVRVFRPRTDRDGWQAPQTVVEVVTDDMPFLVDSLTAHLNRSDAEVQLVLHPILAIERDAEGRLVRVQGVREGEPALRRESCMHVRVAALPADDLTPLREGVERVLADVRAAVDDWQAMRDRCTELAAELASGPPPGPPEEAAEARALLEWLTQNHFTFLGYREYRFDRGKARVVADRGLGLLRDDHATLFDGLITGRKPPPEIFLPELVRVTKATRRSTVHRAVRLDAIGVKRFDARGKVIGERIFAGLFTSSAYGRSPREIPLLRRKVNHVLEASGFSPRSHNFKTLVHVLDTYPRDELFQIPQEELLPIALGILRLQGRPRIAFFPRVDPFGRFVSCLLYVPRDRYETALRLRFEQILEETFHGDATVYYTHLTEAPLARLHYLVKTEPGAVPSFDAAEVERRLADAGRSWGERLRSALVRSRGEEAGLRAFRRFSEAFPAPYRDSCEPESAAEDLARVEAALAAGDLALHLDRPAGADERELRLKLVTCGRLRPLSEVLPMLERMGLTVLREQPWRLRTAEGPSVWIRELGMAARDGEAIQLARGRELFHEAFRLVWRGDMESDGFNELVLRAGLTAREVTILRAYCRYLRQARIPFSQEYMELTLARHGELASLLVRLFQMRFDPAGPGEPAAADIAERFAKGLDAVANLDEDRILRAFFSAIEATLRTNYYQRGRDGAPKPYLAFKLDSQQLPLLPLPRPFREIFVYSPRVEAIHLRGGRVARGGIRWSDRREDFRTEVLGLMKAQMVKNAVIVPVGSKGGFVVKRPPAEGGAALKEEVVECYRTLMRGLLDLTDNLDGTRVLPPPDVVRRDDDDPYLVVAADKGTATFSDTANAISAREYGFWLDDAFASGGSAGYDHKKMGITARGAWECVKRHFREMGKDIQSEDFTVAGVGDMSGDVFGNGMLLSRHIHLVAAFNHQHIFLDPDPDPARSFAERQRMFDLGVSTWADYDRTAISEGGGVWPRTAKSIPLAPGVRELLGLAAPAATPAELIQAILRAPVELLWLGGIGTYVRARSESDVDVGDRANDAVRITARELRAKVVGEGANLGLTQRGRIEYALHGGRANTDSIDNSAGVDCSDHEVNIKILLNEVERSGQLTRPDRDRLLEAMTEEVGELVLRDNYLQTQSITVTQQLGAHLLDRVGRFIQALEKAGRLNRAIEFLPDEEALRERFKAGVGLTRPEISVLLSHAKIDVYDQILASPLPDDPCVQGELLRYFPRQLREQFAGAVAHHRLRREIIATVVTNNLVNRVGLTFLHELREKTGLSADEIVRGYLAARDVFGMRALWKEIEALDNLAPASVQATLLAECGRLVERATAWFVRLGPRPLPLDRVREAYAGALRELGDLLDEVLPEDRRRLLDARTAELVERGAPQATARKVAVAGLLAGACDVVRLARDTGRELREVAATFFLVGSTFGFNWLRRAAAYLPSDTAWEKLATVALVDELDAEQARLTARVLEGMTRGEAPAAAIARWSAPRRSPIARCEQLLAELQSVATPDFAMVAVALRQLKSLA